MVEKPKTTRYPNPYPANLLAVIPAKVCIDRQHVCCELVWITFDS